MEDVDAKSEELLRPMFLAFKVRSDEVHDLGTKVFGSEQKFVDWINKSVARQMYIKFPAGLDKIEELLGQLDEGYF